MGVARSKRRPGAGDVKPGFRKETRQGTVPEAIRCFMEAGDFEHTIRNAISIGGDSDTLPR